VLGGKESSNPGALVAYVTPVEGTVHDKNALRHFAQEKLPAFMVPSIFVSIENLPRLASGKIDRRHLPKPESRDLSSSSSFESPQTELEQKIAAVWQEILDVNKVGIHDNFFELGGNSLQIARVHSKLEGVLGREVGILDLFRYPTIHVLAKHLVAVNPVEIRPFFRHPASSEQLGSMRRIRAARRRAK
jgi:acyl carrier protein